MSRIVIEKGPAAGAAHWHSTHREQKDRLHHRRDAPGDRRQAGTNDRLGSGGRL
jgi:hypothetical protein